MSQRQKKKASQGKKRYYDTAKKHETQRKASQSTDKQTADNKTVKVPVQSHLPHTSPRKSEGNYQHKSYSKRKITSNWSRYDEVSDGDGMDRSGPHASETEEELQQRLLQLFNLPTQSFSTPLTSETRPPDVKETSSYITLDCNTLAESLASLPVHERLGLSTQLLELGGCSIPPGKSGEETITTAQERTQSESVLLKREHPVIKSGGATAVVATSVYQSGAHKSHRGEMMKEPWQERFDFNPHIPTSAVGSTAKPEDVEDNSELDKLLLEPAAAPVSRGSGQTRKLEESHTPPLAITQETDELDDMLDELLA